jgi:hypothetical protein
MLYLPVCFLKPVCCCLLTVHCFPVQARTVCTCAHPLLYTYVGGEGGAGILYLPVCQQWSFSGALTAGGVISVRGTGREGDSGGEDRGA